ncbi:MAG: hypothetical protein ABW198_10505 [Pseudorhodoplanes sp.]
MDIVVKSIGLIAFFVAGLSSLFGLGLWIGYRSGFRDGITAWQKDHAGMTGGDIRAHSPKLNDPSPELRSTDREREASSFRTQTYPREGQPN